MMRFDHVLLIGYGGPREPNEILPFLQALAEGKNISSERLKIAARSYEIIGGGSPYYDEAFHLKGRLEKALKGLGKDLPVFVGMKYWHPMLKHVVPEIASQGYKNGLAIALNAFPGAIAGAGYPGSLEAAKASLKVPPPSYVFLKGWYDQDLFIQAQSEELTQALRTLPEKEREGTPVLFSFHSLPLNKAGRYAEEARIASELVAQSAGQKNWSVVYQSKPLGVAEPWLGPDIGEVLGQWAERGNKKVVVVPLGFLCDHVEILYDLDHRARLSAGLYGMSYLRARTVIDHPKITELLVSLIATADPTHTPGV